ncbi:MAG: hypothetical protein ACI9WU_000240 [Myxococcota bacterium]|jgi:hypothetical protein
MVHRRQIKRLLFAVCLVLAACEPWADTRDVVAHYPIPVRVPNNLPARVDEAALPLGNAPADADAEQLEALWWVNTYRAHAGLEALDQVAGLNASAAAHATYLVDNPAAYNEGMSPHEQAEGLPGFLAVFHWQRMLAAGYSGEPFSEVIDFRASPAAAVTRWVETVYHRLPLLHPEARHVGYGRAQRGASRVDVLDIGAGDGTRWHIPGGAMWPPDGAQDVVLSWNGAETPRPPVPAGGFPSGPVISLTFGAGQAPMVAAHALVNTQTGQLVAHTLLEPANDDLMAFYGVVTLYANAPLAPGVRYQVRLSGTANGAAFERVSVFTTRNHAPCDLVAQNCGPGRACHRNYDGQPVCTWAGSGPAGAACATHMDCAAGTHCAAKFCTHYSVES